MYNAGKGIYFINPLLGFLFFGLYALLITYLLPVLYAGLISISLIFIVLFVLSRYFNVKMFTLKLASFMSFIAISGSVFLWIIGYAWIYKTNTYVLIGEILIILQLMILNLFKIFLKARLIKKWAKPVERTLIDDLFFVTVALQYALTLHIFVVFVYKQITDGYYTHYLIDGILYELLPVIILAFFYGFHFFRASHIIYKLHKEEWLPIITENGNVTGRIAKKVTLNMKNKYLHPVVRIALVCDGKIFLQIRSGEAVIDPGKLDHPFEKYILFKHDIDLAVKNSIRQIVGRDVEEKPRFLFKYTFENEETRRLVFLYLIEVDNEEKVKRIGKMTGKFWTVKQIDEEFNSQIFGECFELEYEYLKHVVLLCDADNLLAINKGCEVDPIEI